MSKDELTTTEHNKINKLMQKNCIPFETARDISLKAMDTRWVLCPLCRIRHRTKEEDRFSLEHANPKGEMRFVSVFCCPTCGIFFREKEGLT